MPKNINEKKYNYFYRIVNNINGHFYYGIHSTDDLDDGYMGSGTRLNNAYKKYGIENFTKEILKFFDDRKSLAEYESEIVTESLVHNQDCYNISCGGESWKTIGTVVVKDSSGNTFRCDKNDPRYISGEYTSVSNGLCVCYDKLEQRCVTIDADTYHKNKDRYCGVSKGKVTVIEIDSSTSKSIDVEEFHKNRHLYTTSTNNRITVVDKDGNIYSVFKDDERFKSGELKLLWEGRHHKDETKKKISERLKEIGLNKGEKNSQFNTCWVSKDYKSIRIKKEDLEQYLNDGYTLGRHIKHPDDCYQNKIIIVECEVCGKPFEIRKQYTYGNRHRTCSHECAQILAKITRNTNNSIVRSRPLIQGEIKDKIIELRKQGLSADKISKQIGVVSKSTVERFLKANKL